MPTTPITDSIQWLERFQLLEMPWRPSLDHSKGSVIFSSTKLLKFLGHISQHRSHAVFWVTLLCNTNAGFPATDHQPAPLIQGSLRVRYCSSTADHFLCDGSGTQPALDNADSPLLYLSAGTAARYGYTRQIRRMRPNGHRDAPGQGLNQESDLGLRSPSPES